jgi:hypothetical protein
MGGKYGAVVGVSAGVVVWLVLGSLLSQAIWSRS